MEDEEITYEPYRILLKVPVNGKQDYWISKPTTTVADSPRWTEFHQFVADMKKNLIDNIPMQKNKKQKFKNPYGRSYNPHLIFNPRETRPAMIENGGNI